MFFSDNAKYIIKEENPMATINFSSGEKIPLEMHKVRVVQKLNLPPVEKRLEAIKEAGNNTFLLRNRDVFLDMLTDSGVNAMSDRQQAAMFICRRFVCGQRDFLPFDGQTGGTLRHEVFSAGASGQSGGEHPRQPFCQAWQRSHHELPFHHHQSPYYPARRQSRRGSGQRGYEPHQQRAV